MPQTAIEELTERALQLHQQGRLVEAQRLYYEILARQPDHHVSLHLLGTLSGQLGNGDLAIMLIRRALAIEGGDAVYHYNLGRMLAEKRMPVEAGASFREALRLDPGFAEAHCCLGDALLAQGLSEEAIAAYREALRRRAGYALAHNNLGNALYMRGNISEAAGHYQRAGALKPDFAEAFHNLAVALREQGLLDEAIVAAGRAIAIKPDYAEAHNNLGITLQEKGRVHEAMGSFETALRIAPGNFDFYNNLGNALNSLGRSDDAITAYRRALALNPRCVSALVNLGSAIKDAGELGAAIQSYKEALALNPALAAAHSNLVYTLHFHPSYDARAILEEHRTWDARHGEPLKSLWRPHANDHDPTRRLRIGFVSPDLRDHVVGRFLLPLLAAHDRQGYEVFCYSDVAAPDAMTERLRAASEQWRGIAGQSDEVIAELVREDGIDVLIDLTMHMSNNRLLLFARKPAPVQATYLAYCSTTGLSAMDYRISDPYLDAPENAAAERACYSEKTIRLESYWCYAPAFAGPVAGSPVRESGRITFGCFNNFCKVSEDALVTWAEILRAVPDSRLMLHANAGSPRRRIAAFFAKSGIEAARVEFVGAMPLDAYFEAHRRVDIALDTFPYAGGTTTCDALWMGVPAITLSGQTAVGRGGVSILSNLGMPELIARTKDEYIRIAIALARDQERLGLFRMTLRDRMRDSPLMDAPRLARNFESCLRRMWAAWCSSTR